MGKAGDLGGIIYHLARRLQSDQHGRQTYRKMNLIYPETGEHLILHFERFGATFIKKQTVEAA